MSVTFKRNVLIGCYQGAYEEMKASEKKSTTNLVPLYDAKQADVISKIEGIGYISNTSIVDAIDADYSDEYYSDESMDGINIDGCDQDDCDDSDDDLIEIKDEADESHELEEEDPDYDEKLSDDFEAKIEIEPEQLPQAVLEKREVVDSESASLDDTDEIEDDDVNSDLPTLDNAAVESEDATVKENGLPLLEDAVSNDFVRRSTRETSKPDSYNSVEDKSEAENSPKKRRPAHSKKSSLPKPTYTPIIRTDDSNYPYKCDVCSKGFKLKQILVSHLKIHRIQNHPFLQKQVGPSSAVQSTPIKTKSSTELIQVIRVATPKTTSLRDRFRCNYCDKRFIEKITLLVHLNEHIEYKSDVRMGRAGYTELAEENGLAKENGISKGPPQQSTVDQPIEKLSKKLLPSKEELDGLSINFKAKKRIAQLSTAEQLTEKLSSKKPPPSNEEPDTSSGNFKSKKRKRSSCSKSDAKRREEDKDVTFRCDQCPRWYRTEKDLETHLSSHVGEKKYDCDVCFKSFKSDDHLNEHRKLHAAESRTVNCPQCNVSLREGALREHRELHCKGRQCECRTCGRRFVRSDELEAHLRGGCGNTARSSAANDDAEWHECRLCKVRIFSADSLARHMRRAHGCKNAPEEEVWITAVFYRQCSVCEEKFTLKTMFAQHMRSHFSRFKLNYTTNFVVMRRLDLPSMEVVHEYKCYVCVKPTTSFTAMADHVEEHRCEMPAECCNTIFLRFDQFVKHKRAHMEVFTCEKCECLFSTSRSLEEHQEVHKNPTAKCASCSDTKDAYKCNICKRMFESFETWEEHVQLHRGDDPVFKAQKLPELTASDVNNLKSALEYIRNVQTTNVAKQSNEPAQCKFCERSFSSLVDLYDHRSVHLNRNPSCNDGPPVKQSRKRRSRRGGKKRRERRILPKIGDERNLVGLVGNPQSTMPYQQL